MKDICNVEKLLSDSTYIKQNMSTTPIEGKSKILKYLRNGKVIAAAAGSARDILSGELISGELTYLTDGVYGWRSDIPYYVDKYNIQLNDDFVQHVISAL